MPIRYERDGARRRVVIIAQGTIEPDDAITVIERQCLDDTWRYGVLYDLRLTTGRLTLAELRPILDRASQRRAAARGPIAILASDPTVWVIHYHRIKRSNWTTIA
jgi:hypothetical protein